jgi:hypothetical protein
MEPMTAADELPALYRAVLDRVAELEASGRRDLANHVRAEATRIYSRSWNDDARRRLVALLRRHADTPVGREAPRRGFRRRFARAV